MQGNLLYLAIGCIAGILGLFAFNSTQRDALHTPEDSELVDTAVESSSGTIRSPWAVVSDDSSVVVVSDPIVRDAVIADGDPVISEERYLQLVERLEDAEARISTLEQSLPGAGTVTPENVEEPDLLAAGFDPFTIDTIETIRNDVQLQRLELRDRATREGWINSDQFRQSIRALRGSNKLRESLGDEDYDRLLRAEGRDNRVSIESVIANSAADLAGIEAGDIIFRYADDRIFTFRDLRNATTSGEKDEQVTIQIMRNGTLIDFAIPRGPLGVTISPATAEGNP